ncbi:MAG: hypothetical protein QM726_01050 [Chitinophagaceae bacterium]
MFKQIKLTLLAFIVMFVACKKASDPATGKTITTDASYISFSSGNIIGIPFNDGAKTGYLNMVPQTTGNGNASVSAVKTTITTNSTAARPSTSSGDFIEALPLDETNIVTIELDASMIAPNGETYKKIVINKSGLASFYVGSAQVATMTSSAQASAGYPLAKAALNDKASHIAGRYQVTFQ